MDTASVRILADLNTAFYGRVSKSFSQTRSCPWDGWQQVASVISSQISLAKGPLLVTDVACGNMRFAAFLQEIYPDAELSYVGLDNCSSLAAEPAAQLQDAGLDARFVTCDLMELLLSGRDYNLPEVAAADVVACFGFMHHVPSIDLRERFLRNILGSMKDGSLLVLSFWQFLADPKLGPKALTSTEEALKFHPELQKIAFEQGDCFLGWQDDADALRYCHSFSDAELDELVEALSDQGQLEATFYADGKSGKLNRYLVFRKMPYGDIALNSISG